LRKQGKPVVEGTPEYSRAVRMVLEADPSLGAKYRKFDLLEYLLAGGSSMNHRHQDPAIQKRTDVPRPFYFIRPYVLTKGENGVERKQRRIPLGFCDEMSLK
jgi:hypothetical protein